MVAGVTFVEEDRSFSPTIQITDKSCYTIRSSKGPVGSTREVRSYTKLVELYGDPLSGIDDHLVIKQAVDRGTTVILSRIVHHTDLVDPATSEALYAKVTAQDRIGVAGSASQTSDVGPFMLQPGHDIVINPDSTPEAPLSFTATRATVPTADPGGGATAWNLGTEVLNVDVDIGGVTTSFTVTFDDAFATSVPADPDNYTQAETLDQIDAAIGGQFGTIVGNTVVVNTDHRGTGARIQVTGGSANTFLTFTTVAATGTGNVVDISQVTATEFKTLVDAASYASIDTITVSGGAWTMTTVSTGASATLEFDSPSLAIAEMGITVGGGGQTTGTDSAAQAPTLIFQGESQGEWANAIQFSVSDNTDLVGTFDITIPAQTGVGTAEFHSQLNLITTSSQYVVTVLANNSKVLRAVDQNSAKAAPFDNPTVLTYTLVNGDNGVTNIVPADFLGTTQTMTGVNGFNGVTTSMNLFVPGLSDRDTVLTVDIYTAARADMVYFFSDFPNPNDTDDMIAYRNGTSPYSGTKFDSNYLAMYGARPTERDFTGVVRELSGAGHMGGVLTFNDTGGGKLITNFGTWFAPTGLKRGKLNSIGIGVTNYGTPALKADRAALEAAQVNLFLDFGSGPQVHDQRTTQTAPTALRDLNVRRFLIQAAKDSISAVRDLQWDPLDPIFFSSIADRLEPLWQQFKDLRAVNDFRIECDQNVDTIEEVQVNNLVDLDNGKFRCLIFLKPTRAAREIALVGVITATSTSFDEIVV